MDELKDASCDGGFANSGYVGKRAEGSFVFQDYAVELGHIELVSGGARGNVEGEALAGEDGSSNAEDKRFNGGLYRGER